MAKQETSRNNGGNGKGSSRSIAEMHGLSEGGRASKRRDRHFYEKRRESELEAGEFYTRTNDSRSNNLQALLRGEVGDYAVPGGNDPSMHLTVQNEHGKYGPLRVIRIESIQRGHELQGRVFDPRIFLPCSHVKKFGMNFRSRFENQLAAVTQELICHYLADQLGAEAAFGDRESGSSTDLLDLHAAALDVAEEALEEALTVAADEPKKPGKKQQAKIRRLIAEQRSWQEQQKVLENFRKSAISLRQAGVGKMGYVVMTHPSGELIVLFSQIGADKTIRVIHLSEHHMLKIAGVHVGQSIFAGQLINGGIDNIDRLNHRMNEADVKAGNSLIEHIRSQLEAIGIKLRRPRANLRLMKQAA